MTTSASTPRLRLTQLLYVGLLAAAAMIDGVFWSRLGAPFVTWLSFLLVASACLGRLWCSVFIAGRKDAELVTIGPYARCRHPLYAWSLVAGLGLGIATRSLLLTLITLLVLAALFWSAIRREEAFLQERFGAQFTHYAASTPVLLPRFALPVLTPESVAVNPAVYRKAFLDAGSMLLLWSLIETAQVLHRSGVWRSSWTLL